MQYSQAAARDSKGPSLAYVIVANFPFLVELLLWATSAFGAVCGAVTLVVFFLAAGVSSFFAAPAGALLMTASISWMNCERAFSRDMLGKSAKAPSRRKLGPFPRSPDNERPSSSRVFFFEGLDRS